MEAHTFSLLQEGIFCNSLILKTPSRRNETVYHLNTSPLVILHIARWLSCHEVERKFSLHVTDFIFFTSLYTCWCRFDPPFWQHFNFNFLNHINCFCNDLAIFFSCISLSKLKWQRRHLQNNHCFDCSLIKVLYLATHLIQTMVMLRWIKKMPFTQRKCRGSSRVLASYWGLISDN